MSQHTAWLPTCLGLRLWAGGLRGVGRKLAGPEAVAQCPLVKLAETTAFAWLPSSIVKFTILGIPLKSLKVNGFDPNEV